MPALRGLSLGLGSEAGLGWGARIRVRVSLQITEATSLIAFESLMIALQECNVFLPCCVVSVLVFLCVLVFVYQNEVTQQ